MNRRDPNFVFVPPRGHSVNEAVRENRAFFEDRAARDRYLLTKDGFEKLRLGYYDIQVPPPKFDLSLWRYETYVALYRAFVWMNRTGKRKKPTKHWEPDDGYRLHCEKYLPESFFQFQA